MIPYEGEIKSYDPINKWYHIVYKDGDTEDFTVTEVKRHRKQNQQYSRDPRVEPLDLIGGLPQSIPTISNQSNKVNKALSAQEQSGTRILANGCDTRTSSTTLIQ
jgi:hypothetical protein